jgi:ABC-type branched-subunit amino acid transport system substrate-binding protein
VDALTLDDDAPGFQTELTALLNRPEVLGAVGGVARNRAAAVADYLRQINRPWLGPWSNDPNLYRGQETDPFAILPHSGQEMEALLGYVKQVFTSAPARSGPVYLVFYNFPDDQEMAARASRTAADLGLNLQHAPVNPDFSNWPFLAEHLDESRAVIIWLSQGHTAALVKAAKSRNLDAFYLTSSVNATNRNLVVLSGGAWNGMIFPAVLSPSQEIPAAYDGLLRKYGPVGLDGGYLSYLGFSQGQILARALNLGAGQGSMNLPRSLYDSRGFPTLLAFPVDYAPGRHASPGFYLGRAYGNGHWEAVSGLPGE